MKFESEFIVEVRTGWFCDYSGEFQPAIVLINGMAIPGRKMRGTNYEFKHGWGYCGTATSMTALQICRYIFPTEELALALSKLFEVEIWQRIGPLDQSFEKKLDLTDFYIDNRRILLQYQQTNYEHE